MECKNNDVKVHGLGVRSVTKITNERVFMCMVCVLCGVLARTSVFMCV